MTNRICGNKKPVLKPKSREILYRITHRLDSCPQMASVRTVTLPAEDYKMATALLPSAFHSRFRS